MENEVSALMGVNDEVIWKNTGFFSSVDDLSGRFCSKCPSTLGIKLTPPSATELPKHIKTSTEHNLHISQDPLTIEGQKSGLLAGEQAASLPFEHIGQFFEV